MKEFIDKLINELEKLGEHCLYMNNWQGQTAICDAIEIVTELAEEYKDKPSNEWETIYDKVCSLEKKYANDGNVERVNDCIKLENLLQYFKEELQSAEEYKLFGKTEQVKGGWIPCSERLPQVDGRYLCSYNYKDGGRNYVQVLSYYAYEEKPHFQHEGYEGLEVVAWCELPAPYAEGE